MSRVIQSPIKVMAPGHPVQAMTTWEVMVRLRDDGWTRVVQDVGDPQPLPYQHSAGDAAVKNWYVKRRQRTWNLAYLRCLALAGDLF